MISKKEKKEIIAVLGPHYTHLVMSVLKQQKTLNRYKKQYSLHMIRLVMGGVKNNDAIEAAIFEAVRRKKIQIEEIKQIRATILK